MFLTYKNNHQYSIGRPLLSTCIALGSRKATQRFEVWLSALAI